ncbi:MAG TPA: periplasmic heavy metal sensor [bacterium]|jgi:Spy/CpxP family protein refolding chaperone
MSIRIPLAAFLLTALLPLAGWGQGHHGHGQAAAASPSPYVGQQARDIKALAPEQVAALLDGGGMGYAKAAELNHYPGPRHVIDLAEHLQLSETQRARAEAVFAAMQTRARELGADILRHERELDAAFGASAIDDQTLERLTARIATLEGELRVTHLRAHRDMRALLTPAQVSAYDRLRGYAAP